MATLPEPPAGTNGYFLEENGLVKVQFEDIANGAQPPSGWVYQDASNGNNPGFEGDGYYYWKSETSTQLDKQPTQGLISATVYIQNAGTYNLYLRSTRDSDDPSDQRNDIWVKVDDDIIPLLPLSREMITVDGFAKLYGASTSWGTSKNFDDANTNNNPDSRLVLSEGFHTITFAGRSQGFHIDSFQLNTRGGANNALESSQFVTAAEITAPEIGAATLTITPNEDVQGSNFGSNSFRIENVGDKTIAKVEIDVTDALLRDAVFDPFGLAGDTVTKPLTINSAGNTGVAAPSSASYIGAGGTAGYEKIQLVFNQNSSGGFQPGEAVGFAIDMDPNSIAGAQKDPLDAGTDPAWDVGGVNGAELVGSRFTVTFTDGTTATGQLQGVTDTATTNSQGGGRGLATQTPSAGTVSLEVAGLSPGEAGSYASGGPEVVIDGPAGATARIVLLKGFIQPGDNLFTGAYKAQLDAQLAALAASDFPANNAVEFQVRDVVLTGAPQNVTALFNFDTVPVPGVANPDALPLGFVAGLIDPQNDDLPAGPVTTPIYLVADDGSGPANAAPVAADDTAASAGAAVTVDVLGNDTDADGDALSLASFTQGANGTVARDDAGTPGDQSDDQLVYTPAAGFSGQDSFTYTIGDGQGGTDTATVNVSVSGSAPAFELYINAGGGAYTALDGTSYVADTYFSGGVAGAKSAAIAGTGDDALFNAYRLGEFGYAIPVANGTYVVDLSFSEFYWTQDGARVFDVGIEGATVLDNFDVHAAAGARNTAFTAPSITVEVTDGTLDIGFEGEVRAPLLQAIGIRSASTAPGAAPVAADDAYAVAEDGTLTVGAAQGVLANDSDADGGTLTASVAAGPAHGTLSLAANGSFVYTPEAGFSGPDGFSYTVTDDTGRTDGGTVAITVAAAANAAPVAADDTAASAGAAVTVDVLGNDTDADGDALSLASFTQGANGTVARDDAGTPGDQSDDQLVYTPAAGFSGQDSFTYTIGDGQGGTDTATVTVIESTTPLFQLNINAGGGAYTSTDGVSYVADSYFVGGSPYSTKSTIAFTDDPILFQTERYGQFGYAIPVADGIYEVTLDFAEIYFDAAGQRIFDVQIEGMLPIDDLDIWSVTGDINRPYTTVPILVEVTDGTLNIDFLTEVQNPKVSAISVRSAVDVGNPPDAVPDAYVTDEDTALTVGAGAGVLANDSDADAEALTASLVVGPANGSVTLAEDGSFNYVPALNFNGTDSFTYAVRDETGLSSTATVTIGVAAVNDPPVAVDDAFLTSVDTPISIPGANALLENDVDVEGDELAVVAVNGVAANVGAQITLPSGALLSVNSFGRIDYEPAPGFTGEDTFTYTVSDGTATGSTATVTIDVVSSLPPVVEVNAGAVVDEAGTTTISAALLQTTDPDTSPDMLVYTLTTLPVHGTLTLGGTALEAGGSFTQTDIDSGALSYVHDGSETLSDGFGYEVTDGLFTLSGESFEITVSAINDAPVAADESYLVDHGTSLAVNAAGGVLANDTDVDSPSLAVGAVNGNAGAVGKEVTLPSGAKLNLKADGSFVYEPLAGFSGEDSFAYTVGDGSGGSDTATVQLDIAPAESPFALHINAGGNAYTASNGVQYVADSYFSGGKKYSKVEPIAGTADDALFQTERFATSSFSYNIAVEPGTYAVSLDFAELSFDAAGQRVFDVKIEGKTAFDNLDIWAEAGDQFTAYEPAPYVIDVIDGELNIEFVKGVQNPKVSAISVVDVTSDDNSPIAQNDSETVRLSSFVAIDVLENDLDLDGDALQIVSVGGEAKKGTVSVNDAGTPDDATDDFLVYTSNGSSTGKDTFSYAITDGTGKTSSATVTVDVLPLDAVAFDRVPVTGIPDKSYTSIQFGPDDRLYASDRFGEIFAFEVEPQLDPVTGKVTSYAATSVETITLIKSIPNHDDDGSLAPEVTDRQVTGFVVGGTAENPVLYVGSSDPREGGGGGGGDGDLGLDTNSGIISRLSWNGTGWEKLDLVRGLPRSEENHSTNGLLLTTDPDTGHRILLASQGGNTNSGAPSKNFAYANETALSAAILKIDLTELESGTGDYAVKTDGAHSYVYDLPTVMGDTVGVFGGRDGLNQARLVEGSPVSVYSSGWRNAYDLVETEDGDIFTIDNGANQGWGGLPAGEGTGNVSNQLPTSDPDGFNSVNNLDHLEWVQGPGYYGGHPNPIRANPDGAGIIYTDANGNEVWAQNPGGAWPPVDESFSFPDDNDFLLPGVEDNALVTWKVSTNGIAEYTSSGFQGAMQGNLLAAAFDSSIYRIVVNGSNTSATKEALASGLPGIPLDVIAQGDNAIFPGTIWIAYVAGGADIEVLVPTLAIGTPDDFDGDGYSNADEAANGTNPNSPSSVPPDNDGDFVSDLTDDDDDGDTLLDWADHFALDPQNGTTRVITDAEGFFNPLRNDDPGTGFAGLGFTGWMTDGVTDYLDRYDDDNLIAGGTSGIFTIIETTSGDARGGLNTQDNGFQFGVVANTSGPMIVQAAMLNVFSPLTTQSLTPGAAAGIHIGSGDQDNYVKLAVGVNASGELGVVLLHEENGIVLEETFIPGASVPLGAEVQLYFEVDADTGGVTPGWKVSGEAGQTGDAVTVSGDLLAALLGTYENDGVDSALAVGVNSTNGGGDPFAAQYDFINVFAGTLADEFSIA